MRLATLLLLLICSGCVPQVLPDYDRDPGRAIAYERTCGFEGADCLASQVNIPQSLGIASHRHYHLGGVSNGGRRKVSDMAHDLHVKIVKRGAGVIKDFRDNQRDVRLDLSRADLSGADLKGADLSGADLSGTKLKGACLSGANLHGANLIGADLHAAILIGANLSSTDLSGADLHAANLYAASLGAAKLHQADLSGAVLKGADLSGADLKGADLHAAILTGANLSSTDLSGADLRGFNLSNIDLHAAIFIGTNLTGANFLGTNLTGANLTGANLSGADLSGANLTGANLTGADLKGANLKGANLTRADLTDADLLGAKVDSTTMFSAVKCPHALVDRSTAAYMRDSLTLGPRMDLVIVDDLATLRAEFSGVWGAIQLIGVMVFILPYAWFLSKQAIVSQSRAIVDSAVVSVEEWVETQSVQPTLMTTDAFREATLLKVRLTANEWRKKFGLDKPTEISIADALMRYIWNGGERWREGYYFNFWPFVSFIVVALYNALRLTLLIKTKKLETQEAVRQLPVVFSMGTGFVSWRTAYDWTRYGFWVALALILKNTFYFMSSTIQI